MKKTNSSDLDDWWQSPLGQCLFSSEQDVIRSLEQPLLGYTYLQLGGNSLCLPEANRPIKQCLMTTNGDIEGKPEALPFKSHSIDNMLIMHVLEQAQDPHQLLRETERVLAADGKLILCSFNPFSLWGLRRLFSWQDKTPWDGHFFTQTRIKDWLALLNFEVVEQHKILFRPPFRHSGWLAGSGFMERWGHRLWPWLGGVSVMVATKRTIPLNPIREKWRQRSLFPTPKLVNKPLTREKSHGSR